MVFSGDLTGSTEIAEFRDAYPERFFSLGMAEQNMLSWAGGMAREGFTPYIHTFAVFMYRRPYDQLAMSVAYPNLRVRLVGFLPGITTPGGVTHQAIEDLAVLRGLPNLTIFEMGDATDVESILDVAQAIDGPVYIRMIRQAIPRLFPAEARLQFNRARVLSRGTDITLISTGICTEEALRATTLLKQKGVSIQHLHVTTIKPFSDPLVLEALSRPKYAVVTMENHTIIGGVGTAVAEMMAENAIGKKLVRIGIPDTFAHGAEVRYLMREYGLDAMALVRKVEEILGESFNISEDDLAGIRLEPAFSVSVEQLEAL
ncbi:MAG: transketolase C-terminal domain-containing protein [Anaerolineae bacterium]|nr:transketolase C-terminal domain-containing protein [Anaerolineae bacterium]